ncbi:MAG: germination protein YpeB, partial [Oscillospiraceae bacterium]|nr:germination protein YpeB [Oscillospiraceae bacterium]
MPEENYYKKRYAVDIAVFAVLTAALLVTVWFAYRQHKRAEELNIRLENHYERAFSELTGYIDDIKTSLDKSMVVSSPAQMASLAGEIYKKASAAKSCLGQLPLSEIQLDNTSVFLAQAGDFTYVLSQDMINGKNVSDEYYDNLTKLADNAEILSNSLLGIQAKIINGEVDFIDNGSPDAVYAEGGFADSISRVEEEFMDYPSLIYDGPFSEHIENAAPAMCEGQPEIDMETARSKAAEFIGCAAEQLEFESGVSGNIAGYAFTKIVNPELGDSEVSITVSKKGGFVIDFLSSRIPYEDKIDIYTAIDSARNYLESKGFTNLKNSYFDKGGNVATVNFAYVQDGVTCYSDLIKVRVALDNGEILGTETSGYITNHKNRLLDVGSVISEQEARAKISGREEIRAVNLALIPKDNRTEVLC